MLVNDDRILMSDENPIIKILNEGNQKTQRIRDGIYIDCHFNSYIALPKDEYKRFVDGLSISSYGVCDNYKQVLKRCPGLKSSKQRKFILVLTKVVRAEQPSEGGWRWHKWGPYIGKKKPRYEYLYDEKNIDAVFVYNIYEKK